MSKIFLAISILIATSAYAQITISKQPILLGKCDKESLLQTPYIDWFQEAYNNYKPGPEAKKLSDPDLFKNCTMEIFFGSWCGDSKREVPHFLKLLHEISFPMEKVQMIAVGNRDTLLKQSPGHEEEGKGIFRVPTFIIYKNEEERKFDNLVTKSVGSKGKPYKYSIPINTDDYILNMNNHLSVAMACKNKHRSANMSSYSGTQDLLDKLNVTYDTIKNQVTNISNQKKKHFYLGCFQQ